MGWAGLVTTLLMLPANLQMLICISVTVVFWGPLTPLVSRAIWTRWSNVSLRLQLGKVGCNPHWLRTLVVLVAALKVYPFDQLATRKLHFLLGDIAVTLKLKITARCTERCKEEKRPFSWEMENFRPKEEYFWKWQLKCSSLMHSLLSERYLYWRKDPMWCKRLGCMLGEKKIHEQTFIVCKWRDRDTDEKGWELQTIACNLHFVGIYTVKIRLYLFQAEVLNRLRKSCRKH